MRCFISGLTHQFIYKCFLHTLSPLHMQRRKKKAYITWQVIERGLENFMLNFLIKVAIFLLLSSRCAVKITRNLFSLLQTFPVLWMKRVLESHVLGTSGPNGEECAKRGCLPQPHIWQQHKTALSVRAARGASLTHPQVPWGTKETNGGISSCWVDLCCQTAVRIVW